MRKAQRYIIQRVLCQDHVVIRPSQDAGVSVSDNVKSADSSADKPGNSKTSKKPAPPPASPQKVIRNIDGALAPAVLSYLQHNGFSASASAMRKDMSSRKRLLDTGLGEVGESRVKKLARTDDWYKAQETGWQELQQIKSDYREDKLPSVWHKIQAMTQASTGPFLESDDGLWACRIRVRYFYKIVRKTLRDGDARMNATSEKTVSLPELFSDIDFKRFILNDAKLLPTTPEGSICDVASVLLAIGSNLQAQYGQSPNAAVQQEVEAALSYMVYDRMSDLPKDMFSAISQSALAEEAEELLKAIRSEFTKAYHPTEEY